MNSSTTRNRNSITTPSTPHLVTTHSEWTWSTKIPQDTQSMDIDSPDTCYDSDDFDFLSDDEIDQILNTYQAKINRQVIDKDIIENQVSVLELERSLARQRDFRLYPPSAAVPIAFRGYSESTPAINFSSFWINNHVLKRNGQIPSIFFLTLDNSSSVRFVTETITKVIPQHVFI
ncbi:hypothetical protein BC833DRAFT_660010 [Globomyces pollinis-pini]|nr:hypothetical protein BC833DRAFT_660010 [Globomyces pollinis-pini]